MRCQEPSLVSKAKVLPAFQRKGEDDGVAGPPVPPPSSPPVSGVTARKLSTVNDSGGCQRTHLWLDTRRVGFLHRSRLPHRTQAGQRVTHRPGME